MCGNCCDPSQPWQPSEQPTPPSESQPSPHDPQIPVEDLRW